MTDADEHTAQAKAELDDAVASLFEKLSESAGKEKGSLSFPLEKLGAGLHSEDGDSTTALVDQLVSFSLDDAKNIKSNKPLTDKIASFVGSLLPLTSVALGVVGKAVEGASMGAPVSAITQGICIIIDMVIKERDRKELFLAELDRLAYQARRVQVTQRHPDTVLLPLLREKSLNLLTAITLFLAGALDYFRRSLVKQIAKSVFKGAEAWQGCITQLHLAYEEYDQALLLQIASTVLERARQPDVTSNDDVQFRDWLQPSAAENESKMMASLALRAEGTLQWVLDMSELRSWRLGDASAKARTLWLTGLPGVGKTCISAYLCDLLPPQYPDDIVLNFFCRRGAAGLTSAFAVVRTLAYQLTQADEFYRRFLQEKPGLPKSDSKDDIAFFVTKLLKDPLSAGPASQTIYILLDGLDELEDAKHTRASMLYTRKADVEILLEQLVSLPRVKILATSRRLPELNNILSESGAIRQIGPADNAMDIQNYVKHRVANSAKLRAGFSGLGVDPVDFFSSKANGVFLWVSIVLDVLERAASVKAFRQALDETHPTMNSIYDDIFARAEHRGSLALLTEVLHWTLILPATFTVRQMALAVEISLGDKFLDMEQFLRTECGALLDLMPRLGSGSASDDSLEIYIGHETFQAWFTDRLGLDARLDAHAKAATTCLKYLLGHYTDNCLRDYALERWRWHLRQSMGVGERRFAEPATVLDSASPVSAGIATSLFPQLYRFLAQQEAEEWLLKIMANGGYQLRPFSEVHRTYLEVAAWCRANKDAVADKALDSLQLDGTTAGQLKTWRGSVDNPQVIAGMLWPRACHAWLWNGSPSWWTTYWNVEALYKLYVYALGEGLFVEGPSTKQLLDTEKGILERNAVNPSVQHGGKLDGTLTVHFANTIDRIGDGVPDVDTANQCLAAVKVAGRCDDLSSVCAYNVSVFHYYVWRKICTPSRSREALEHSLDLILEAIDDDPDGCPRNYYHLGNIYKSLSYGEGEAEKKALQSKSLDAFRDAMARDPGHETDARQEVYQAEEDALRAQDPPALEAAAELLERAIVDDPENCRNRWYHHLFEVHKERGDLAAARDAYRRLIAFDPTWHTKWENIADTWIDTASYENERTFDWPNWCDALLEAVQHDPSYAHSYWHSWKSKAENLAGYQHFDIAISILRYGAETTAVRTDAYAKTACAEFYYCLGEVLGTKGDFAAAIPALEEAFARTDNLEIWGQRGTLQWLAWAYMAEARWDDALAVAEKRLVLPPHEQWGDSLRYAAHSWKADVALYQGQHAAAAREIKLAVRLLEEEMARARDPDNDDAWAMAHLLVDLATVYDRMGRAAQVKAVLNKALPHAQSALRALVDMRERNETLWRKEGRWHLLLGWVLERGSGDAAGALEQYELAAWVFGKTVYVEDDFVEFGDVAAADAAVQRVRAGVHFTYPDDEAFRAEGLRLKIASKRSDWGNGEYMEDVQKPRRRGKP